MIFLALGLLMYALDWIFVVFGMHRCSFSGVAFPICERGSAGFLLIIGVLRRFVNWAPQKIYLDVTMGAHLSDRLFPGAQQCRPQGVGSCDQYGVVTGILALANAGTLGNILRESRYTFTTPSASAIGFSSTTTRAYSESERDELASDDGRHAGRGGSRRFKLQVAEMPLTNFMRPDLWSRRSVYFVCPYSVPPARVRSIVLQSIEGAKGVKVTKIHHRDKRVYRAWY